jgi:outer membrane protein OmpA-like peptidoglycan-associated protein
MTTTFGSPLALALLLIIVELSSVRLVLGQTLSAEEIQQQLSKPRTRAMRNLQIEAVPKAIATPQDVAPAIVPTLPNNATAPSAESNPTLAVPTPAAVETATIAPVIALDSPKKVEAEESPQVALQIQFEFNSAKITPHGDVQVNELAKALNSKMLEGVRFQVEGHTDAVGRADYNLKLSQLRADAIAIRLSALGVERSRLSAIGMGDARLLSGLKPSAPEHRRVVVMARN